MQKKKKSGENKIWTFADQTDDIPSQYYSIHIKRRILAWSFHRSGCFAGTGPENNQLTMQKMPDAKKKASGTNKFSTFAEQTFDTSSPNYSLKIRRGTLALCSQFLPCALGSDLEDSQHKEQTVSGIYQYTLNSVSGCPNVSEYYKRATDKCAEVCTSNIQDGICSYHCMRDSYKTGLVEFCAKPKFLFGYCPEYDPIGRTIQKDIYTPCNSSDSSQIYYSSSDLFFCDQSNCLQLRDTGVTGLMTQTTPRSGDIKDTWLSQNLHVLLLLVLMFMAVLFIILVLIKLKAHTRELAKKRNHEGDTEMGEGDCFITKVVE